MWRIESYDCVEEFPDYFNFDLTSKNKIRFLHLGHLPSIGGQFKFFFIIYDNDSEPLKEKSNEIIKKLMKLTIIDKDNYCSYESLKDLLEYCFEIKENNDMLRS